MDNLNSELSKLAYNLQNIIFRNIDAAKCKSHLDNGLVISINNSLGTGKSFFIEYFINMIHDQNNKVHPYNTSKLTQFDDRVNISLDYKIYRNVIIANYNASEDDYLDPFISIVGQICTAQTNVNPQGVTNLKEKFTKIITLPIFSDIKFLKVIKSFAETANDLSQVMELEGRFDKILDQYQDLKNERKDFKKALSDLEVENNELLSDSAIKIIIIDELDRCEPHFAVRLLNTIKHFFNTPNVVFIIAVDKLILCDILKGFYGANFNSERYLSRFFDFELRIPYSQDFYSKLLYRLGDSEKYREIILYLFKRLNLPAREAIKSYKYLCSLRSTGVLDRPELVVLLIIKQFSLEGYCKIINWKIRIPDIFSDGRYHLGHLRTHFEEFCALFFIDINRLPSGPSPEDDIFQVAKNFFKFLSDKIINIDDLKNTWGIFESADKREERWLIDNMGQIIFFLDCYFNDKVSVNEEKHNPVAV